MFSCGCDLARLGYVLYCLLRICSDVSVPDLPTAWRENQPKPVFQEVEEEEEEEK